MSDANKTSGVGGGGGNLTTTTTAVPNIEMPLDIIIVGSTLYSIVFLVGIVGNLSVIYVLTKEKGLRNFTNYLLANLSIADLLVLIACVPSGMHDLFAKERWYLGRVWCYMVVFIENCMGIASLLSIFFITMERFYVICRPLKVKSVMTQSRTLKLILFIWLASISINLPFIYLTEYRLQTFFDKNTVEYKCVTRPIGNWSFYYILMVTYVLYFVVGLVLLAMYYKITRYLRTSMDIMAYADLGNKKNNSSQSSMSKKSNNNNSIRANNTNTSLNDNNNNNNNNNESAYKQVNNKTSSMKLLQPQPGAGAPVSTNPEETSSKLNVNDHDKYTKPRKQLIMMLMCVIVSFYVCLFPLKIWTLILMFIGHRPFFLRVIKLRHYWYISIVVRFFFYANSSINPIMYNYMSKKFRRAFKELFVCRLCNMIADDEAANGGAGGEPNLEFKRSSYSTSRTDRRSRLSCNIERDPLSKANG